MKTAAMAAANGTNANKNAKGKNNVLMTTNNARLSRRDQEHDVKTKKSQVATLNRRRMPSMDPKMVMKKSSVNSTGFS